MRLTLNLTPELEAYLKREAALQGIDPGTFVLQTLRRHLETERAEHPPLSPEEANLLQEINIGISPEKWERRNVLIAKREDGTLQEKEQKELVELTDEIELANARRLEHLASLARLRGLSLSSLMAELGIKPASHA